MKWMINQKRYRPLYFAGSIIVMTLEIAIIHICLFLLFIASKSQSIDWYQQALKLEASNDIFFEEKSQKLFTVLAVAVVIVVLFCFITSCIFRRQQLDSMKIQIGSYMACGYSRSEIENILARDVGFDILVSLPFAGILSGIFMKLLQKKEEFLMILSSVKIDGFSYGIMILWCAIGLLCVILGYEKLWIRGQTKQGMAALFD